MRKREPLEPLADQQDHEQHLRAALVAARRSWNPDLGMPEHEYLRRAVTVAEWDWSRLTRREKIRRNMTVRIDDLLNEPASPGFLPSVMAASEIAFLTRGLSPVERVVVESILAAGRPADEVASQLGVTKQDVRRIKRRAVAKVRRSRL